jgi:multiple sugar transport system substrate-binding protein
MGKFAPKLLPAPREIITRERYRDTGPQQRELVRERRTLGPTPTSVATAFVDSVVSDAVRDNKVLGLPLSVDTLALYANTDLLAYAGISAPAKSWEEMLEHVKRLRVLTAEGDIKQAAVAIGTAENVPRSQDVLLTLMLQNGVELADQGGAITMEKVPSGADYENPPAAEALRFYADFSDPTKSVYTWSAELPDAVELFRQGRLAYLLGYSYHSREIALAPKVRFVVSAFPQPQALLDRNVRVALANTWLEGVSRKTKHPNEAWDFLQFATGAEQAAQYLAVTKKPAALRSLVEVQKNDPMLGAFAFQSLVSRSWYRGANANEMEASLRRAIAAVTNKTLAPAEAVIRASQQIQETMRTTL